MSEELKSIGALKEIKDDNRLIFILVVISIVLFSSYLLIGLYYPLGLNNNYLNKIIGIVGFQIPIFIAFLFLLFRAFPRYKKYRPCPYCDNSVKMYENWACNYCKHIQKELKHIVMPCEECERKNVTFFCEHCHEEFKI